MPEDTTTIEPPILDGGTTQTEQTTTTEAVSETNTAPAETTGSDWRTPLALDDKGEVDKEALKVLGRYHSPAAFTKAYKDTNDKIARGEFIKPLPAEPTDDDIAAWNKALGVPETPAAYREALPEGLVISEDEAPVYDKFFEAMHKAGARPNEVSAALSTYRELKINEEAAQADQMDAYHNEAANALKQEWGEVDYQRNVNATKAFISTLPEEVQKALSSSVYIDPETKAVRRFGDNPEVVKWVASLALDANPLSTVVPNSGNQAQALQSEIDKIEELIGISGSKYWKGDGAAAMQQRYQELLTAREKAAGRG